MNALADNQNIGPWRQSARSALIVLTAISLLNYLDRYIVASLVNELTQPSPNGLGLSGAQVGWLSSGFVIVYLLTSPLFGSLADRRSRPRLIAAGVTVWAIATAAGGLAGTFAMLFAARSVVGIGEAAYGTAAPAMLADAFPKSRRGRVFAIFYAAVPLGAALGYVLGGLIEQHYGWRSAFFIAGLPGLALAVLVWLLKDPPRGANDPNLEDSGSTMFLSEAVRLDGSSKIEGRNRINFRPDGTPIIIHSQKKKRQINYGSIRLTQLILSKCRS